MKTKIKKALKMITLTIVSIIALIVIGGIIFLNISPQFGGKHSENDIKRYQESGHYQGGKFINLIETNMDMSLKNIWAMSKEFIKGNPNAKPNFKFPINEMDSSYLVKSQAEDKMYWFGHSTFLLQLDSLNILIDPMFGDSPAPHPTFGTSRFHDKLPIEIEKLPHIDLVLISHDHYDHLDYESIQKLKGKVKQFYVPLGVGAHLKSWGINENYIAEYNWWDETNYENLQLAFTPARHFSGRGLMDNSATMWGSWVIKSNSKNIFFSGDSGYGPHFKEIGEKYGPFDFAMMECGQYNEKWANIHMMPEETAQAGIDVKTNIIMPIHWGAFKLALHDWDDPIKRITTKADELKIPTFIPEIGQKIDLSNLNMQPTNWWK